MKLGIALLLMTALQVAAKPATSQETVTINLRNAPLSSVLKSIQQKTSFRFVFSNKIVGNDVRVSLKAEEAPVLDVLSKVLNGTGLEFEKLGDRLIVIKQDEAAVKTILVKGTVVNAAGEKIVGATVSSSSGAVTVTNSEGGYAIEVDENATLTISYVGYKTQTVKINGRTSPYKTRLSDG